MLMLRGKYRTFNIQLVYKEGPGWDEDVIRSSVYSSPSLPLSLSLWRQSPSLSSRLNQCFTLLCYHQTSINSKHRGIADNDFPNIYYRNLMWCKDYIYIFYFQHKGRHRRRASKENGNLRLSEGQNHLFGKYSTFLRPKNIYT